MKTNKSKVAKGELGEIDEFHDTLHELSETTKDARKIIETNLNIPYFTRVAWLDELDSKLLQIETLVRLVNANSRNVYRGLAMYHDLDRAASELDEEEETGNDIEGRKEEEDEELEEMDQ